ncbi:MAG TPA: hypothetical protein VFL80_10960, partial [Thermoanaerobaculia bacterium]|nr:hypothetical protein [Thermoanaerobaculia bacterium]
AIRGVTYVTIFHENSPSALLQKLRPDFHCKGTDYTADSVPEAEVVRAYGGKVVIVGVNGDESVRQLKGEGRPVMSERERAELISAIRGVTYVTIFHQNSPSALLKKLKPDFHCKGTDYTADSVPEADVVRAYGGKVVIVGDPKDHSTTALLEKMRRQ